MIGPAWSGTAPAAGAPVGATATRAVEQIGFFTGLGVAIVWVALLALGRFSVTGAWDTKAPAEPGPDTVEEPADSALPPGSAKPHGPQEGSALTWHQDWRLAVPSRYLMLSH